MGVDLESAYPHNAVGIINNTGFMKVRTNIKMVITAFVPYDVGGTVLLFPFALISLFVGILNEI